MKTEKVVSHTLSVPIEAHYVDDDGKYITDGEGLAQAFEYAARLVRTADRLNASFYLADVSLSLADFDFLSLTFNGVA